MFNCQCPVLSDVHERNASTQLISTVVMASRLTDTHRCPVSLSLARPILSRPVRLEIETSVSCIVHVSVVVAVAVDVVGPTARGGGAPTPSQLSRRSAVAAPPSLPGSGFGSGFGFGKSNWKIKLEVPHSCVQCGTRKSSAVGNTLYYSTKRDDVTKRNEMQVDVVKMKLWNMRS